MKRNTLVDEMIAYMRRKPEGVTSFTLAETFLKCKNPDDRMAHIAVSGILTKDTRCMCDADGIWFITETDTETGIQPLERNPWAVVFLLCDTARKDRPLHVSVWSPYDTPHCLLSAWLVNPRILPYEEQELLCSNHDAPFTTCEQALVRLSAILQGRTVLFLSSLQQRMIHRLCCAGGESIPDDTLVLSQLLQITGMAIVKPLQVRSCYLQLFGHEPILHSAYQYGEALCECFQKLLSQMVHKGIATRNDLDAYEQEKTLHGVWDDATFTVDDIACLSSGPGVYGFKNRQGGYIYIGKATNLRRRLFSYFRNSDESPEKVLHLRKQAHDLTVHRCGSELESLLLEQRLIKKHAPSLNTKVAINERKGTFTPVQDCIILLPHSEKGKGMSIWFRRDQKILMRPFSTDFNDAPDVQNRLQTFFFQKKLPAQSTDFEEQEIVFRWITKHRDTVTIIPVSRMGSAQEIYAAWKSYWIDR